MLAVNLIDGSLGVFSWSNIPTGGGFIKLHASLRLVQIVGVKAGKEQLIYKEIPKNENILIKLYYIKGSARG